MQTKLAILFLLFTLNSLNAYSSDMSKEFNDANALILSGKFAKAKGILNKILEHELAGVVRYNHYSFMVYGYNRIPIVSWLRQQATESMDHAQQSGEMITHFGGHPSLGIGQLLETHNSSYPSPGK